MNGFNSIAPVYDALATLVFGRSIRNAQLCFLGDIGYRGKVLILGGGTGWFAGDRRFHLRAYLAGEIRVEKC